MKLKNYKDLIVNRIKKLKRIILSIKDLKLHQKVNLKKQ